MFVKITENYNDLQLKKSVKEGTELEVTAARGAELIKAGVAVEISEETEPKKPKATKKKAKKTEE